MCTGTRGTQGPHLHQEAEGPAGLVLQDSELHARCKDGKVPVRHTGPWADSLPGLPPRVPAEAGLGTGAVAAEARCPSCAQEAAPLACLPPLASPPLPSCLSELSAGPGSKPPQTSRRQKLRVWEVGKSRLGLGDAGCTALQGGTGLFPQNGRGTRRGAAALLAS